MTVTALDAAADRDENTARAVLGDLVLDNVRFHVAALIGALDGGDGDDPGLLAVLTAPRSYSDLWAMLLLACDVADKAMAAEACGINPGLAAANARRMAEARHRAREYAHLRDGGVIPEAAGARVGVESKAGLSEYETAYRAQKRQRRGEGEVA